MDVKEIKKLLETSASVLVMENGQPSFIMMSYEAYKQLVNQENAKTNGSNSTTTKQNPKDNEVEVLEKINKEILALKDEIEKEEKTLYSAVNVD